MPLVRSVRMTLLAFLLLSMLPYGWSQQRETQILANNLSLQFSRNNRKVIAVAKFTNDDGYDDRFSRFLAGQLTALLQEYSQNANPTYKVVDRMRTSKVLDELNLRYTKPFDPKTFGELGKGTGADTIVTGEFRVLTNRVTVNCVALNPAMEEVAASIVDIARTQEIDELLGPKQSPVSAASGVANTAQQPISIGGFEVQVNRCRRRGGSIVCELTITNQEDDRDTHLDGGGYGTIMYDYKSRAYPAAETVLAAVRSNDTSIAKLLQGTPADATLTFDNVPEDVKGIRLLEVKMWSKNVGDFKAKFSKGIPIQ